MAYTPKYISFDDIPVQIPDDYSTSEKEDALETAEAELEADINSGREIDDSDVSVLIQSAVKQRATCELAKGSEHPDDVALGDLDDRGDTKIDYANEGFCDTYNELVDKILSTDTWSSASGEGTSPYTYSTADPSPNS